MPLFFQAYTCKGFVLLFREELNSDWLSYVKIFWGTYFNFIFCAQLKASMSLKYSHDNLYLFGSCFRFFSCRWVRGWWCNLSTAALLSSKDFSSPPISDSSSPSVSAEFPFEDLLPSSEKKIYIFWPINAKHLTHQRCSTI